KISEPLMASYQDMLLADAYSNYRTILEDVTLSPAMGDYLDMANNAKVDSTGTVLPNENFAREVMQLFSLGPNLLNQDGTSKTDGLGNRLPAYTQQNVADFARVFTGWTYSPANPGDPIRWPMNISATGPLQPYAPMHDTGSKQLLQGAVLP